MSIILNREKDAIFILEKSGNEAKFWLTPYVSFAYSWEFSGNELNEIEKIVFEKKELIEEKWNEYCR